MMRGHMWTGALLVSLLAAAPAAAIVIYERGPGLNLSVVDNGYNGTPGSMRCDDLTIADPGSISSVVLRLGMSHTWVSDLVVKLRSPSSTLVTVLSRPGLAETVDDGTPEFGGDSSNLVFASRISFDQASVNSAESMGGTIGDNEVVCQDDAICTFQPNPGAALPGTLADFSGESFSGTWTLCIGDAAANDLGVLDDWALVIVTTQLFSDGFEKGDECSWTVIVGGGSCA
jgi:subtilisin-like proprotein convertase family protein